MLLSKVGKEKAMTPETPEMKQPLTSVSSTATITAPPRQRKWAAEEDIILKVMWAAGKPAVTIGLSLGRSDTSVWSRVKLLKLGRHPKHKHLQTVKGERTYARHFRSDIARQAFGTPVTLIDIAPHQCHWPLDEKGCFCGGKAVKPYGYCKDHNDIAWVNVRK